MLSHVSSSFLVATLGVDPTVAAFLFTEQCVEPSHVIAAGERKCFDEACESQLRPEVFALPNSEFQSLEPVEG